MSISAVLVNYYTASFLSPLIQSLHNDPLVQEIIIVDNSDELSGNNNLLRSQKVKILVNKVNKGFAAAVNQGVQSAGSRYMLIVNPDVRFFQGCIADMLQGARQYEAAIVGPRFFWDEEKKFKLPPATGLCWWQEVARQCADKSKLDADLFSFYWTIRHDRFWNAQKPFFEPFLSGACLLVDRKWIRKQGEKLFDERFFLYFEDSDLCVQALMDTSTISLCIPAAEAVHYWNQSPSSESVKLQYMSQSKAKFLEKYYKSRPQEPDINLDYHQNYKYLGEFTKPPVFSFKEELARGDIYLEFGINAYLVPFAQALVRSTSFSFPDALWSRLAPGEYFWRVRSPIYGTLKLWKWKKV